MPLAVVTSLLGLVVVLVAYYREERNPPPAPATPEWDVLPTAADVARADFPLAFPGYEPATVDLHLETLATAYTDLLAVAPPEVVERARRRAEARRAGLAESGSVAASASPPPDNDGAGGRQDLGAVPAGPSGPQGAGAHAARVGSAGPVGRTGAADEADAAALRAEAALGDLRAQGGREGGSRS